jgi:hypothetical protein
VQQVCQIHLGRHGGVYALLRRARALLVLNVVLLHNGQQAQCPAECLPLLRH